ncbi:MAG TPA: hypothetical protein VGQ22_08455 [Steroidobacteraceae bacterium]|jgi:hypothetical protein|nr:hypothetical protein [Steroidobacteraceae bacterium]
MTINARYLVVVVALLAACTTQSPRKVEAPAQTVPPVASLTIRMEYATDRAAGSVVAWTRQTRLWMGLVRGAVMGTPDVTLQDYAFSPPQFTLDLEALTPTADEHAQPLIMPALARGFRVEPVETRIARVGTYSYDAETGDALGFSGFIDPADRQLLTLIYVDRPCRLYGTIRLEESKVADLDARASTAGFHWLKINDQDPAHQRIVLAPPLPEVTHLVVIAQ